MDGTQTKRPGKTVSRSAPAAENRGRAGDQARKEEKCHRRRTDDEATFGRVKKES
jgi:hypothetical protein